MQAGGQWRLVVEVCRSSWAGKIMQATVAHPGHSLPLKALRHHSGWVPWMWTLWHPSKYPHCPVEAEWPTPSSSSASM